MALSPMMQQYMLRKEQNPGCLLFFRMGDFYEMFFDDAVLVSRELEITLTARDCGLPEKAPMCGVPHHALEGYLNRLIEKGYKVAICEQLTDPAESKGLVERDVVRIVTPGTVIDPAMLEDKKNNYILAVCLEEDKAGLAWADISTGELTVEEIRENVQSALAAEWARIAPSEVLGNGAVSHALGTKMPGLMTVRPEDEFDLRFAKRTIKKRLPGELSAYGCEDLPLAVRAAGALLAYLEQTQKRELTNISALRVYRPHVHMHLDPTARRNLELTRTIRDAGRKGSLLWLLDQTATAMGGRQLRAWIEQPLLDLTAINHRLDAVQSLYEDMPLCGALTEELKGVYDMERLLTKVTYGSINPRECLSLKQSLGQVPHIHALIAHLSNSMMEQITTGLDPLEDLCAMLEHAIDPEPSMLLRDGGVIRPGFNEELDELRNASQNGHQWLMELEQREKEATGIKNLRIGFNKVFGYYIEVTKSNISQVPYRYQRKQTLTNGERYITEELKKIEDTLLGAQEKALRLETQLFATVREQIAAQIARIQSTAWALKELDALHSLAKVAMQNDYTRPTLHAGFDLTIEQGRHPVVEKLSDSPFVPNDTLFTKDESMVIITGPNMAGKSTYMRQVALITLMAHIGSFVPAASANIPLTDRIFTRVGASDDLSAGQSTFMVEMREMSEILANATPQSLLVLDEIGRGTSTFDGLSIAWASVEYILGQESLRAKTLFATHYHELTELEGVLDGAVNYFVDCKELGEDIIFLRTVKRGGADRSYGVHVAALAGLPQQLVARAREILAKLEVNEVSQRSISQNILEEPTGKTGQVGLLEFSALELAQEIAALDVNYMSPKEALDLLYVLREKAKHI